MNFKKIISGTLLLFVLIPVSGQNKTETRSFLKSFHVTRDNSLEVSNKYGTVTITTWKKDSASIRAEIKAYAPSQDKLKSMFDGLTVSITDAGPVLSAQTVFTQNINRLFESFKGMTSKIISYDSKIEINYFISVPEYLNLTVDNKYGDVYMENCSGKLSLSLSNGSLKANNLGKGSVISVSFCDATIGSIASGEIDASFSEISTEEVGNVKISSISSKFDIRNAGEVTFESRRDKFFFGSIGSLMGDSYFTDFTIKELGRQASMTTRYGNFTAESVRNSFESINLNSGYTDIYLNFGESSSYNLDVRHINSFLSLPPKNSRTEQKTLSEEKKEYITFGSVGNNPGQVKVKIDATRCKIYLK